MLRRWLVLAFACALLVGACGDDDGGGGGGGDSNEVTTLKVGVIPIADVAPLYLGMEKGYFKDENLEIEPQLAEGGAAIVPAVVSGDYQIGFSNVTSLVIASSKKLPVQIISQGVLAGTGPDDAWDGVVVPKGSKITEPKDFEGASVAVNTLNNIGPLVMNESMEKAGADYTKIKYVEVPFPEMNAALEAGRVDAAWEVEPAFSGGKAAGGTAIMHPYEETEPNLTVATYFASKDYIAKNTDVVERFKRAIEKSLDYAQQNPDEVRKVIGTYTEIPAEVLDKITLPQWKADLNEPTIQLNIDLSKKFGFIDSEPTLDDMIWRGE
ncbi:MAG TPA: ABC transporter substrate-binding protein [Solirubrobacteraceae bacterium]|jgi:NitT/TauT family transport system substrate-binding protein|nr:ABC transporter substrate-binding protein [Solirubrobacteraceae bacterium]